MNSFLLACRVKHERYAPKRHAFEYPVHTCLFDLADLPKLDGRLRFFGYNRFRVASLLDRDYLTEGQDPIRSKFTALMADNGLQVDDRDTIYMVTSPRFLNHVFNPVCFYWVFRDDQLRGCVAEVNNTFGEKHVYPLPGQGESGSFPALYHADKTFHVSPFFDRKGEYEFHFSDVREQLTVTVKLFREGKKDFEATLFEESERVPLTDKALLKTTLSSPFAAHLTTPRILWEAARIHLGKKIGYNPKPAPMSRMTIRRSKQAGAGPGIARKLALRHLGRMPNGKMTLQLPDKSLHEFGKSGEGGGARIQIHSPDFFSRVLWHGDIGLGETYSEGLWDTPDLVNVILFFLENRKPQGRHSNVLGKIPYRANGFLQKARHKLAPRNDEAGSKRNIAAHYDLSNDLFSRFLDPSMTYSSALFLDPCDGSESLIEAQARKNRVLADKIDIGPDDHVLEIGCGWGGFARQTALERGCRITGVTVSEEQLEYARQKIREAGLEGLVDIQLRDYRRIREKFDKVVSIEMLEAVGHEFHAEFFRCMDRLLKPGGLAAVQTITIQDPHYDRYRWSFDWIRKHIFPGGLLPSLTRICEVTARETSLVVQNVDAIGLHYANTLRRWREEFNANWDDISCLGFDEYFKRTWNYYLAVCEAGFTYGHINNLQIVFSRAEPNSAHKCCCGNMKDRQKRGSLESGHSSD